VALGAGSIADQANTVSVGSAGNERKVVNVAAGTASTDAVNVGQLNAVVGEVKTDVTDLQSDVSGLQTNVSGLQTDVAANTTAITANTAVIATHSTAITNLQTDVSTLQAAQDLVEGRVDTLFDLRHRDRRDMKQGVAAAMSMANAPMPSAPGRLSYAVNGATFRGEYALGGSLMYRLPGNTPFAVNAGFSFGGHKNNGVRVGVAGEF
jgi:hypothetical protein